ncbi:MAG: PQQ-binding-like beta-propeller repeat protein [Planctomycetota bacterium]|nr:PQQ-binding-like beta-propeller repeat protein [Planctomycetota bacterium]
MRREMVLSAWLLLATSGALFAMTADEVVQQSGISGGLCSFPCAQAADEKLIIELAKRPAFVVQALSQDVQVVARLRDAGETEGLLGRTLYVEKSAPAPLPVADRLVDLLVATSLRDADLTPELRSEWLRALSPRRGTALVGRPKTGEGLSQEALKTWIKDLPMAQVIGGDTGLWALLRTDLPAGSDSWTHRNHGPENAQVSTDATLKAPFLTQWWGMPRQEGFWGTTVVSGNSRMFTIRGSRNSGEGVFLSARSLTNGLVLWQRPLRQAKPDEKVPHGGYIPGRSCVVVSGNTLFLVDRDSVSCLNAETGVERHRIVGPKPEGQVKWIASADGLLAVLSGDPDTIKPIAYQTISANPTGRDLAVYDPETKKELWRDSLPGDVDERSIVVRDGRLYCMVQDFGLVCRELRTGKPIWTNPETELHSRFRTPTIKVVEQLLASQPALMALDDVLLLRAKWSQEVIALSRQDGKLIWKRPSSGGRAMQAVAAEGLWLGGPGGAVDLKTGAAAKGPSFISSGCGPTTAIPGYLITCFGKVLDTQSNKVIREDDIKSPCDVGTLVSEGIMLTVPSECGCVYEMKGYRALTAAGSIRPHTAPPWKERLTVLDQAEPAALNVADGDWPAYRHDSRRSGASTATVGEQLKILWQWKPANAAPYTAVWPANGGPRLTADFVATAPVAAAGFVWFASHDGVIRCVKADTGKEVWKFATGSMLFSPPTINSGRVLAGGGDGRIYCLDATTGRSLWTLRAAPVDRRVFWFGHLISTWPLASGVVVEDGVGYAVAGYQKENGIHAYAFDPKTGQVLWERDDAGGGGGRLGSSGGVALSGGKLWVCSSPAGYFDAKTGEWKTAAGGNFGSEVGVFDKWLFQGGRRLSETQDTFLRPLGGSGFTASTQGPPAAQVPLTDAGTSLPAWDVELAVMPPKGPQGALTALPIAKLLSWLEERSVPQPKLPPNAPKPKLVEFSASKTWATESLGPVAFALAKDQVVVASTNGKVHRAIGFNRADGKSVWSVGLPEQPAMNRIALDRDGRVLVSLCDGSIICLGR